MRTLLLEIKDAGKHGSLRLVELAMRVRMHHKGPELIRRMRRNFVLHHSAHSECARHETCYCVDDYYEWGEDLADETHDRHGVLARGLWMFPGNGPRHQLPDYYMKQHGQCEPASSANDAQPDRAERAPDARSSRRRRPPILVFDRNGQRSFSRCEDCAHRDEHDNPDQPGRQSASPTMVL